MADPPSDAPEASSEGNRNENGNNEPDNGSTPVDGAAPEGVKEEASAAPVAESEAGSGASPTGIKRSGFEDDGEHTQKRIKTEDMSNEKEDADDSKPAEDPPAGTPPVPPEGQPPEKQQQPEQQQQPAAEPESGTGQNDANDAKDPSPETAKEAPTPTTPNNQPNGGASQAPGQQQPQQQQQQQQQAAAMAHQSQMGYPHQMMGGMVPAAHHYPPGMMPGYAPYPHAQGYPGQPPQTMMMGQHPQYPGQPYPVSTGSPTATNPAGQAQRPPQQGQTFQQQAAYYAQAQPAPTDSAQQPMGTSPMSQNRPPAAGAQPQGAVQQMPGMMPMQMPMHMMHYGPPGMFFPQYHMPAGMMTNPMMAQAFGSNPSVTATGARAGAVQQQAYMPPPPPPRSAGTPLSLSCDDEQLSEYQMLVRKQLEVFEAQPEDVESNTQGRKKQVVLGQVGIRCRHCAGYPLRQRGRGAVYYPAKLQGVYQAAQNMASSHLCESCQCIPPPLKHELKTLRDRRDTASGGKQYWADGARAMGLLETDEGLRLRRPAGDGANANANAQSPS